MYQSLWHLCFLKKESVLIVHLDVERTLNHQTKLPVALYVGIPSLKRFSNSADYTSPIDIEQPASVCILA
jgi:hypothetical protein